MIPTSVQDEETITTGESAHFTLFDGRSSAVQARDPDFVNSHSRSRTRFWLVVAIEVLLLATILGIFWCQSRNELRRAPTPRDLVPAPLGSVL